MIPFELGDERFATWGEGHERRSSGARVRLACHEAVYRVRDGQIAEEWICSDMASLFRQLS